MILLPNRQTDRWREGRRLSGHTIWLRVLIFQHRNLLHSGEEVTSGIKLTMRTDLMFEKVEDKREGGVDVDDVHDNT